MRNYHQRKNKEFCPVLNLDKLWTLVSEQSRLKYANATDGKVPVINIVKAVSTYHIVSQEFSNFFIVKFLLWTTKKIYQII